MKFELSFDVDNAAFEDHPDEIAWILRGIADRLTPLQDSGIIFDSNGNRVGEYGITKTAAEQAEEA